VESAGHAFSYQQRKSTQPKFTTADSRCMTKSLTFAMLLAGCSIPGLSTSGTFFSSSSSSPTHTTAPAPVTAASAPASVAAAPAPAPVAAAPAPAPEPDDGYLHGLEAAHADSISIRRDVLQRIQNLDAYAEGTTNTDDHQHAEACRKTVKDDLAGGDTLDTVIHGYSESFAVRELSAACTRLDASVQASQARHDASEKALSAKIDAPLIAAGLSGDKLEMMGFDDDIYGPGAIKLTPAQFRRASVVFRVKQGADYEWTLHRFTFKGDKLISETQEGFLTQPGPSKYR
jgi:hypothetical protein